MKNCILFIFVMTCAGSLFSQQAVDPFTKLTTTGNIHIIVANSDAHTVQILSGQEHEKKLKYSVNGGVLAIEFESSMDSIKLKVTAPSINEIELSSVAELSTEGVFKAPLLKLSSDGATEYHMNLECQTLSLDFEGASHAWLSGTTENLYADLKGASNVQAYDLKAKNAEVSTDGASKMKLFATEKLSIKGSGASEIFYGGSPTDVKVDVEGVAVVKNQDEETINFSIREDRTDTVEYSCDAPEKTKEKKQEKSMGHWGGVDLMMNNFISNYGELNSAPAYPFMETEFAKSNGVQLNFWEYYVPFVKDHNSSFGLTTGMNLSILNYRLSKDTRLINDSAILTAYSDTLSGTIRSKLTATYLMLPLIVEFNTDKRSGEGFHFGAGVFGGVRIGSHTKVVVNDHGDKDKFKSNGDYHLNPFKYGVTARLGWRSIHLFAQYSLSEMFASNEGPAVHPLEFGLTFELN